VEFGLGDSILRGVVTKIQNAEEVIDYYNPMYASLSLSVFA